MNYVTSIEPRLTPHRPAAPISTADALVEWATDLEEELAARLRLLSDEELLWRPHEDANNIAVTAWHVSRWLDLLGTRLFTGKPKELDIWHRAGWYEATQYEPDGIGYLGLGTLTGYSPEEMRAVPALAAADLIAYLSQSVEALVMQIQEFGAEIIKPLPHADLSPYQLIGSTLQGSFGHVGEVDTLVALRARTSAQLQT